MMSNPDHKFIPDLDESILHPNPIMQFKMWFDQALAAKLPHADAMTVATATKDGRPSARVVLLKLVDDRGLVFFTNYKSRKGGELSANPRAALVSYWPEFNRQVRVEGTVSQLSADESDAYFATRPRDSQLSSLTSAQSETIASRGELDRHFEKLKQQYEGKSIPRPSHWGGYRVHADRIEFWQSRFARLNDRILYTRQPSGSWTTTRLQP
jgi:pyridoxamine 5'-phosphate oxidase